MSRESILAAIKGNQPAGSALPDLEGFRVGTPGDPAAFRKVVETLGGELIDITAYTEIQPFIQAHYTDLTSVVAVNPSFYPGAMTVWEEGDGRQLEQVDLAIIPGQLGVAENGAVWVT